MENIKQKAQDDQDFLYSYGSVRTGIPSRAYQEGWERIFHPTGRDTSADVLSSGESVNN